MSGFTSTGGIRSTGTGAIFANNCTIGKKYIIEVLCDWSKTSIASHFAGGTVLNEGRMYVANTYTIYTLLVEATATAITFTGSVAGLSNSFVSGWIQVD